MSNLNSLENPSSQEAERLEAVRRYDILDTPPEEQFDRVVRLAARWFDVPISLVTLLSTDRQWFKARKGIDCYEMPRKASFCRHNIHDEEVLVVEDATKDPRFKDNPLVVGAPGIHFYAGAPLVTPGGHVVGSLCIIDTKPRDPESVDFEVLQDLAAIVVDELELRVANKQLEDRNRDVQELVDALTSAEETERQRLSELLHEDLQQLLQAVRMKAENLSNRDDLSKAQRERLDGLQEHVTEAIEVTRGLSARFAPPIGNQPLAETFRWLTSKMEEIYGLSVHLDTENQERVSDETIKALLYRVVRELLFNVVKHAQTGEARLSLTREKGGLRVVVEDEGKGFVPENGLESGLGLTSVRKRIEELGGNVKITSQPGVGTRVTIEVPPGKRDAERL
jgi:signal transduction histidine kinase